MSTTEGSFDKKTFNIKREYTQEMKELIPSRKQTEFVNKAIEHELQRIKENAQRKQALKDIKSFAKVRKSLPKSKKPSEEVLKELRNERINNISNIAQDE